MKLFYTISLLFLLSCLPAQIRFEADFNTLETGSTPYWLTTVGDRIFFSATDGYAGWEPWIYDPTIRQAYKLADINPASASSSPRDVVVVDGALYFVAVSINQQQIWRLLPGASEVEAIATDSVFNQIRSLTFYEGALYFQGKFSGDPFGETYLHRYQLENETVELVENTDTTIAFSPSFPAMQVHNDQLYLLGRILDNNLQALITYDAAADTFKIAPNQLTENSQEIWVTDFRSSSDYLIMNIRDPENLNNAYLGVYDTVSKIINIEFGQPLWPQNPPVRSIEVVGDQVFFRKRDPSRTLLRSYNPATLEVQTIPGINDDRVDHIEASSDQLLIFSQSNQPERSVKAYDPVNNTLTTIPIETSLVPDFRGRTLNVVTRLGEDWFYQGGTEDNAELFRFREPTESITRLTDIHRGTDQGFPRFMQATTNGTILSRVFGQSIFTSSPNGIEYDPSDQSYGLLLPALAWSFDSKVYQLPGYLVLTQVEYDGVDYEAVAYDSLAQAYVPIIELAPNCNGGFTRGSGTFVYYDNALYFPHCDDGRLQLYRHQLGVAGAERVSNFVDQSLLKGSLSDETIGRLGDDLIMPIGVSYNAVFRSDLYRYDGTNFSQIDLGSFNVREPSVVQTPNAVYLSVFESNLNIYYPAYLREGEEEMHLITYENDTIKSLFPSNFHIQDSTAYFTLGNQILRHRPTSEAAELYYTIPAELNNAYSPYLFNGRLYFVATDPIFGSELYEVADLDGSPQRVSDINIGQPGSSINSFADNGERLFFAADDGFRGSELWSYQPNCFTINLTAEASNINWPTGSLEATPTSGTPPFTFAWNTGQTTALLQNLVTGFYEVTITDATGCSTSQSAWVETNGIISTTREEAISFNATVYPNPFEQTLSIKFDEIINGDITAEVFTLSGQLVQQQIFADGQSVQLNTSDLPPGIFVVRLRDATQQIILLRKVVKQ